MQARTPISLVLGPPIESPNASTLQLFAQFTRSPTAPERVERSAVYRPTPVPARRRSGARRGSELELKPLKTFDKWPVLRWPIGPFSALVLLVAQGANPQPQRVEPNETGRVRLVVDLVALEGSERRIVQRAIAPPTDDVHVALVQLEPRLAARPALRLVDQRLQHQALGRKPEAAIDERGVLGDQRVAQPHHLAVEGDRLDRAVGLVQDRAARRLVNAARLHADESIL